ncbi:MAG TPA: hypothetical protein VK815_14730 [Candidatus Acidoferrales bacterium]|jgi:hypothetical protein|nr:hypothetical protein [Candidatus Acidoferrales bacterium]
MDGAFIFGFQGEHSFGVRGCLGWEDFFIFWWVGQPLSNRLCEDGRMKLKKAEGRCEARSKKSSKRPSSNIQRNSKHQTANVIAVHLAPCQVNWAMSIPPLNSTEMNQSPPKSTDLHLIQGVLEKIYFNHGRNTDGTCHGHAGELPALQKTSKSGRIQVNPTKSNRKTGFQKQRLTVINSD